MNKSLNRTTSSDEYTNMLDTTINNLETLIKACEYIKNGHTEIDACKKFKLNRYTFRKMMRTNYFKEKDHKLDEEKYTTAFIKPEEILYCELHGKKRPHTADIDLPIDLAETLPIVMDEALTQQEAQTLHMYYWEHMTFEEIGKTMSVSRQYVSLLKTRAIQKLKNPNVLNILKYGIDEYQKAVNSAHEKNKILRENISQLKNEMESAETVENVANLHKIAMTALRLENEINIDATPMKCDISQIPIGTIYMSTRAKHCIRSFNKTAKHPIRNVSDLAQLTKEKLMMIRNVGDATIKELDAIANTYGITIPD
ncbi:hypothetical protein J6A31_05995 [bacterium]|nr:hypothetical protein [bacterium]